MLDGSGHGEFMERAQRGLSVTSGEMSPVVEESRQTTWRMLGSVSGAPRCCHSVRRGKGKPASQADPWQMTAQCPWGPLHTPGAGWASPSHQLPLLRMSSSPGCSWHRAAFIEHFTLCQALG